MGSCYPWRKAQGFTLLGLQEDKMRDKPGFEHLNEPLHVLVEAELPANIIDAQLIHAREILQELLKPVVWSKHLEPTFSTTCSVLN